MIREGIYTESSWILRARQYVGIQRRKETAEELKVTALSHPQKAN